jgi:hexosaminidase
MYSLSAERTAVGTAWLPLVGVLLSGCPSDVPISRATGNQIAVRFEVLDNRLPGGRFHAELALENRGTAPLPADGWELFFNFGRSMLTDSPVPAGVQAEHLNGHFWRLAPAPGFEPVAPGDVRHIRFEGNGWVIKESGAPAGPYFVFRDEDGAELPPEPVAEMTIAPFVDPVATDRGPEERVPAPSAASRFRDNRPLTLLPPGEVGMVVPTPMRLARRSGQARIDGTWELRSEPELANEAAHLTRALESLLGRPPATWSGDSRGITLRIGTVTVAGTEAGPGDEAYRLSIRPEAIEIVGSDRAGVFYGIRTLEALVPSEAWEGPNVALTLDSVVVEDAPRFAYRGIHLDVARNFHGPDTVERLLELASFYKLNRFHFHLTDDEGWRMAVDGLPELIEVGGRRGHTRDERDRLVPSFGSGPDPDPAVSPGSGHYTREELVRILRFAHDRHIQVVPEIDLPGHARAAIRAMETRFARLTRAGDGEEAGRFRLVDPDDESQYRSVQGWDDNVVDVCLESTYRFVERVVEEIVATWAEAEAPLHTVHIGGDEVPGGVWAGSPACERLIREHPDLDETDDLFAYFLERASDILASHSLATAGWEEIALVEKHWDGGGVKTPNLEVVDRGFRPYVWNNVWGWGAEDLGYRLANAGFEVVLAGATNLYFDLAYDKDPREPGYVWAGFVDTRKPWEFVPFDIFKNAETDLMGNPLGPETYVGRTRLDAKGRGRVLGIQGQLWSENLKSRDLLEYMAFPKLLGLAERAWAASPEWAETDDQAEREKLEQRAWNEFANRLGRRELPRLDWMLGGVAYRLPPPGAVIEDGLLEANVAFPGLEIRWTTDGRDPGPSSSLFEDPAEAPGEVRLATFDRRGRASRVVSVRP